MGFKETVFGFAEKVGDTVDSGVKNINNSMEKNRLKKEINQLNTEINNIFATVGRRVYKENPDSETFKTVFDDVKKKELNIEAIQKQINALDGAAICKTCGEPIAKGATICGKCGAQQVQTPTADVEVVNTNIKVCKSCGEKFDMTAKFCNKCGTKLDPDVFN